MENVSGGCVLHYTVPCSLVCTLTPVPLYPINTRAVRLSARHSSWAGVSGVLMRPDRENPHDQLLPTTPCCLLRPWSAETQNLWRRDDYLWICISDPYFTM